MNTLLMHLYNLHTGLLHIIKCIIITFYLSDFRFILNMEIYVLHVDKLGIDMQVYKAFFMI